MYGPRLLNMLITMTLSLSLIRFVQHPSTKRIEKVIINIIINTLFIKLIVSSFIMVFTWYEYVGMNG